MSNEVIKNGYRDVYSYADSDDQDEDGPVKETFAKGEILQKCELTDAKRQTKPKPRYTEATLVKTLQAREIGRPSTYSTIVETVLSQNRGYAELQDKSIVPTERGIQLVNFLDRSFNNIINLDYTKNMEKDLDEIAEGKLGKTQFLTEFYGTMENTIKNNPEIKAGIPTADAPACPKCGAPMVARRSRFGKMFWGCSKYPKCNGLVNMR